jgi:hypothetical protein
MVTCTRAGLTCAGTNMMTIIKQTTTKMNDSAAMRRSPSELQHKEGRT